MILPTNVCELIQSSMRLERSRHFVAPGPTGLAIVETAAESATFPNRAVELRGCVRAPRSSLDLRALPSRLLNVNLPANPFAGVTLLPPMICVEMAARLGPATSSSPVPLECDARSSYRLGYRSVRTSSLHPPSAEGDIDSMSLSLLVFAYFSPETILPLSSILATIAGWRSWLREARFGSRSGVFRPSSGNDGRHGTSIRLISRFRRRN